MLGVSFGLGAPSIGNSKGALYPEIWEPLPKRVQVVPHLHHWHTFVFITLGPPFLHWFYEAVAYVYEQEWPYELSGYLHSPGVKSDRANSTQETGELKYIQNFQFTGVPRKFRLNHKITGGNNNKL